MSSEKPLFIVLEGIDGSGKTTQAFRLERWFKRSGRKAYTTREPTDGIIGGIIRAALSTKLRISPMTLQILFAADRSEHVREMEERRASGYNVICDRYILSSVAYGMVDLDRDWLLRMNSPFPRPDLTIILDLPAETALRRVGKRFSKTLFERRSLLERVRENFLALHNDLGNEYNTVVIDASRSPEEIHRDILEVLGDRLGLEI